MVDDYYSSICGRFDVRRLCRADMRAFFISTKDECILSKRGDIPMFNTQFVTSTAASTLGSLFTGSVVLLGTFNMLRAYIPIINGVLDKMSLDMDPHPRTVVVVICEMGGLDFSAMKKIILGELNSHKNHNITLHVCKADTIPRAKMIDPVNRVLFGEGESRGPLIVLGGESLLHHVTRQYKRELMSVTCVYQRGFEVLSPDEGRCPTMEYFSCSNPLDVPLIRFSSASSTEISISPMLSRTDFTFDRKTSASGIGKALLALPESPVRLSLENCWVWRDTSLQLPWIHRDFDVKTLWDSFDNFNYTQLFLATPETTFEMLNRDEYLFQSRECTRGISSLLYTLDRPTKTINVRFTIHEIDTLTTLFHYISFATLFSKWIEYKGKVLQYGWTLNRVELDMIRARKLNTKVFLDISIPRNYYTVEWDGGISSAIIEDDDKIYNYSRESEGPQLTEDQRLSFNVIFPGTPLTFETTCLTFLIPESHV